MRGKILDVERRRRWSVEEKLSIILSVGVDGATVTQVALPHVCVNEVLISPTWNRSFVGVAEMGGIKL